jgi:hypothetical protein
LVREFQWQILTSTSRFAIDTHIFLSKNEIDQFWLSLVIIVNDLEPLTTKYMAGYCQYWAVSEGPVPVLQTIQFLLYLLREFQWQILTSASGFAIDTHIFLSKNEIDQFWLSLVVIVNDLEPLTTKYMAGYCQYWAVSARNHTSLATCNQTKSRHNIHVFYHGLFSLDHPFFC